VSRLDFPNMKNHALEHFRRPPEPLNCAQSVLYAYQKVSGDTTIPLLEMKRFGGGRAPGGLCGALHAACAVTPEKAETLKSRFAERTGSVLCREMRKANRHPCEVCVAEAAQLLEKELGLNGSGAC
jgi:hypothetical protein